MGFLMVSSLRNREEFEEIGSLRGLHWEDVITEAAQNFAVCPGRPAPLRETKKRNI
jgi:hypothetical protein